jgi:hypothetical protein
MHDPTSGVIAVLRRYAREPVVGMVGPVTLGQLGIDLLDIPMICLDLEDAFGVDLDAGKLQEAATAADLAALVTASLAARAAPRPAVKRRRSSWMSTAA